MKSQQLLDLSKKKFQLRLNFLDYHIIYVHRSCNKPAHELAALGAVEPPGYHNVWFGHYSNDVNRAMPGDCAYQS
jgi:hypothetical protein